MMDSDAKMIWLRRVLLIKAVITLFVWGLPALLGPMSLLRILDLPVPSDAVYLRLFGGAATAWGVVYWLARRDPGRNTAVLWAGVVDNFLPTLVVLVLGLSGRVSSVFIWISGLLTAVFCVAFLVLMPRET